MGLNPALTRKLLQRQEEKSGEKILSEKDRLALQEDQKRVVSSTKRASNSPEAHVLSEAQSALVDIKKKFPHLSQHVEGAYMKLQQIINEMEKRQEKNDRRPQTI